MNRLTQQWKPDSGDPILICDLELEHLVAINKWIALHHYAYKQNIKDLIIEELNIRALSGFADGDPYPIFDDEEQSWKIITVSKNKS